jgi:helicase
MRIESLEAFGVDEKIVDLWKKAGHERLLPVQQLAVKKGKVLDGKNAIIFSPTSSGKTFVGEMAAVRTARKNHRAIYLVPQKALAEEKFHEFTKKYGSFGIRIVVSTRDRKEYDRDIFRGNFHIAIVVFEKMQAFLVASPAMLRNVGLVVVDELQMIGDPTRGPGLEILLTKILLAQDKPQIIGLSAVLGNAKALADWMGGELCEDHSRPVELRKGVLHDGVFHFVEHNSGQRGEEKFEFRLGGDPAETLVSLVRSLAKSGEQCLVFCKSKQDSVEAARRIAEGLKVKPAATALEELAGLEDSEGKDILAQLLVHGVAYHNADLDWDQRDVIERGFRKNEIMVVCATTTLAVGINLPAKNVFIDPYRWEHDRTGRWVTIPISQAEYENTSGRAGRLGLEESFGRAVIVAPSEFDKGTFLDAYVSGELKSVEPALAGVPLAQHVLNLVASKICRDEREIADILLASYTGTLHWRGNGKEEGFNEKLKNSLDQCVEGGLIERQTKGLSATRLGKLAAAKGITVDTAVAMARFITDRMEVATDLDPLEILWALSGTEDGEGVYFGLSSKESWSTEYFEILAQTVSALPKLCRQRMTPALDAFAASYDEVKRAKKALLLYDWVMGEPTRTIEKRFHCYSGSMYALAGDFAWLAETLAAMAKISGWPEKAGESAATLSQRLLYGVPPEGVALASTRVPGLGRGRVMALVGAGLEKLEAIMETPQEKLEKLITKPVASALRRRAAEKLKTAETAEGRDVVYDEVTGEPAEGAKVEEWPAEYPPSDPAGGSYLSDVRIHLDGRVKKRRRLVLVNDKEVWLTDRSFETALKLAIAARGGTMGWVGCDQLGSIDTYHQVIRRLKKALQPSGIDVDRLVENNGEKQYRFSAPAGNVTIDDARIRKGFPRAKKLLDAA